jgi:hypothetical protein
MAELTDKNKYSKAGWPLVFERNNATPMDSTEIWNSLEEAENYAKNNGTAYVGQTIKVVDEVKGSVDTFIIADTDGKLESISGTPGFAYYSAEAEKASGYIGGGQIDRMFRAYEEQIASLQTTITSLQVTVASYGTLLTSLQNSISSLQNSISSLSARIGDWEDDGKNNSSNSSGGGTIL